MAGRCRELLRGELSMFLFAFIDGVEPTNNAAEHALRHGMLWPASTASFARSVMYFPQVPTHEKPAVQVDSRRLRL
jgi:hypothetical protein